MTPQEVTTFAIAGLDGLIKDLVQRREELVQQLQQKTAQPASPRRGKKPGSARKPMSAAKRKSLSRKLKAIWKAKKAAEKAKG